MKKLLFMIALGMFSMVYSNEACAFKLFGLSFKFKKGTPEWNATKTETQCVGKGFCELEVSFEPPLSAYSSSNPIGSIGYSESGEFCMSFPSGILKDPYWAETFANGHLYIGADLMLNNEFKSKIKNCPNNIKAGNHPYKVIDDQLVVFINQ